MSQKTKWEKEELLKILNLTRSSLRCDLQRKLSLEKEKLVSDIDIQISELNIKRHDILKKHNFLNIEGLRYGCDLIPLHPELKTFDENTNIEKKNILNG
jgi:hypothetical protein